MRGFITRILSIDLESIERARRAVVACAAVWDRVEEEAAKLPTNISEDGRKVVEEAEKRRAELMAERDAATAAAIEKIRAASVSFTENLKIQCVPTAADVAAVRGDLEMLSFNLISTPDELEIVANRISDNPAGAVAVRNYAEKMGWPGFNFVTHEKSISDFGSNWFWICETAAKAPQGRSYYGLFVDDERAFIDSIRAFGIVEEYEKSVNSEKN